MPTDNVAKKALAKLRATASPEQAEAIDEIEAQLKTYWEIEETFDLLGMPTTYEKVLELLKERNKNHDTSL